MNDPMMDLLECKKEEVVTPFTTPQRTTQLPYQQQHDALLLPMKTSVPSTPQNVYTPLRAEPESMTMELSEKQYAQYRRSVENFKKRKLADMEEWKLKRSKTLPYPPEVPKKKVTQHNKNVIKMTEMSDDPSIVKRQCKVCFSVFESVPKLARHSLTHGDRVDATCNLCSAPLKYSYNMKSHYAKCFQHSVQDKEDAVVRQNFPDFLRRLDLYARGQLSEMPTLPEGLKMDKKGKITGRPTTKIITDYSKLIPGWGSSHHARIGYQFDDFDEEDALEEEYVMLLRQKVAKQKMLLDSQ